MGTGVRNRKVLRLMSQLEPPQFLVRAAELVPEPDRSIGLEDIIQHLVRGGRLGAAQRVSRVLGRELTTVELEMILGKQIEDGRIGPARDTARILERKLTDSEVWKMVEKRLERDPSFCHVAPISEFVGRALTGDELEEILGRQVAYGWFHPAQETARQLGRDLTIRELMMVVEKNIGTLIEPLEAADLLLQRLQEEQEAPSCLES